MNFLILYLGINSGNCALFVDTINIAFDIDVKGFKQRSIDSPNNEIVIRGPHEAFVENLRTNTSLLRRTVNNENLVIENIEIGDISNTKCAVCYMKNIANNDLVAEVKFRLNNLDVDSLLSSGELEQLIR
ncbi:MAG: spore germination protein [Clostridia bacterium]|nr:spore germination protein [Clostridia bacterium]